MAGGTGAPALFPAAALFPAPGELPPDSRNCRAGRNLALALAISLALHGLVLLLRQAPAPTVTRGALSARLSRPAAPAPAPPAAAPVEQAAPPRRAPLPAPAERSYAREAAPADPAPTGGESAPAAAESSPAAAQSRAAAGADTPAPVRPAVDLDGLRQYHAALSRAADRFRTYPRQARQAGWEGRVILRLAVSEAGIPIGLALNGSSGFPLLDQAALEMMGLAASHTPVPESLRGRAFSIDLAVDYKLGDEP